MRFERNTKEDKINLLLVKILEWFSAIGKGKVAGVVYKE
jgi:hypothetical protein